MRYLLFFALGLTSMATATPPRVAVGYLADHSDAPVEGVPWKDLTHVCHAYLQLDGLGMPIASETVPSAELAETAHGRGVKILLTVGAGQTTLGLETITKDPLATTTFARALARRIAEVGYDGVDLAWESPRNKQTREGFTAMLAALRQELDTVSKGRAEPLLLTAQVSPSPFFMKWIDGPKVAPLVDWLNVAAYDMCGPYDRTAAHHAPLFPSPKDPERSWRSVSGAMTRWHEDAGVPKDKLVMGLPMFGRIYPVEAPYQPLDAERRNQHGAYTYTRINELVSSGAPAEWDDPSKAPWLRPTGEPTQVIAYDDRNSIHLKAAWAHDEGYRGYYFWALGQDRMPDGSNWLVRAATKAWPAEQPAPEDPAPTPAVKRPAPSP
ncbi:Chitinase A1 precursor [Pirellulimonas nuda]|uniref:chitinase n=1 Tax=Pirellulimonas nuda TaxID=2528009 RepID=A0A518D7E1_9BACT|nr:glycoside hydrolase family 18 protein [Pirellulimonas nuda]QDU87366.1 Chitinase A1 precursor [Pirellulimonas nuda]